MTPEEMRIAIAKDHGKRPPCEPDKHVAYPANQVAGIQIFCCRNCSCYYTGADHRWTFPDTDDYPDYCNDLNAIHEVESTFQSDDDCHMYAIALEDIVQKWMLDNPQQCPAGDLWYWVTIATAAHRAEAYLRTKGLWKE